MRNKKKRIRLRPKKRDYGVTREKKMKKTNLICIVLLSLVLTTSLPLLANNISIDGDVTLTDQNTTGDYTHIQFDISWENSWRLDGVAAPYNRDAAWVFAKFNIVGDNPDLGWQHCTLNTSGHTAPSGSVVENPSSDNPQTGIFIYRSADNKTTAGYAASVDWNNAKLRWNYGDDLVADDATVDVKVFAIEMVYIPEGSFALHTTGDATLYANFEKADGSISSNVIAEGGITWSMESSWCGAQNNVATIIGGCAALGLDYPKGFKDIYCMKYEISQGQYADFLSLLTDD